MFSHIINWIYIMKYKYILLLLSFTLTACGGSSKNDSSDDSDKPNTSNKTFGLSVSEVKINNTQTNEPVNVNTDNLKRTHLSLKKN